ncbi:MAG: NusG domain II-containing protein [Peptoniphilus sp. oral taxon 375]|nr:NusG domain II-containing protein [Peptoniphilus sp. oral taxon 375]
MKKGDKMVLASIIVISLVLFFLTSQTLREAQNKYVSVQISGREVQKISLKKEKELREYNFKTKLGTNKVLVKDGKVWVQESNCPDQICVHMAPIEKVGETIICLPHEFLVEIKADKKAPDDLDLLLR